MSRAPLEDINIAKAGIGLGEGTSLPLCLIPSSIILTILIR